MSSGSGFEERLEHDGYFVSKTSGSSMFPLLKTNRDLVMIRSFSGRLKKYDLPLYRKNGGGYLMHRVIGFDGDTYIIRGDNTYIKEYVAPDRVVGILSEFKRKGKQHSVDETWYKAYSRIWNFIYPLRFCVFKTRRFCGKIKRSLLSKGKG